MLVVPLVVLFSLVIAFGIVLTIISVLQPSIKKEDEPETWIERLSRTQFLWGMLVPFLLLTILFTGKYLWLTLASDNEYLWIIWAVINFLASMIAANYHYKRRKWFKSSTEIAVANIITATLYLTFILVAIVLS